MFLKKIAFSRRFMHNVANWWSSKPILIDWLEKILNSKARLKCPGGLNGVLDLIDILIFLNGL